MEASAVSLSSKRFLAAALGLALWLTPSRCFAGQDAFLSLEPLRLGGYGGPNFNLTTVDDRAAIVSGGALAIATNPGFSWFASVNYLELAADRLEFGYGAVGAETAFRFRSIVQPMSQFQIGYGQASKAGVSSQAFVGELSGMLGFQVGRGEKIIVGVGYREVEGIEGVPGLGMSTLDGWEATLRLSYGVFNARPAFLAREEVRPIAFSGFFSGKWTRLNGQTAWLDGGGTTVIVKKNWEFGVSGYRTRNDLDYRGQKLSFGYGGLLCRYVAYPQERVHFSFAVLGGAGGASTRNQVRAGPGRKPCPSSIPTPQWNST